MGVDETKTALNYISKSIGKTVYIKLRSGTEIRGKLEGFDSHLNLILTDSDEIMEEKTKKLGKIIIRGDTVVLVSPVA